MKFVEPIREPRKIEAIKSYLRKKNERDYILFMVGINTGFRIGDILNLTVGDIRGTHIEIMESKTGKTKKIMIRKNLRKALDHFTVDKEDYEYLFVGRSAKHNGQKDEKIDVSTAYKVLNEAARFHGVKKIGTHSMRKTFGHHYYNRTKDIALLMDHFNHSEESITLRYIGINQDTLDESLEEFEL